MSSAKALALDEVTLALAAASIASCDDFSAVLAESLALPKTSYPLFVTSSTLLFLDSSSFSSLFYLVSSLCFYSNSSMSLIAWLAFFFYISFNLFSSSLFAILTYFLFSALSFISSSSLSYSLSAFD